MSRELKTGKTSDSEYPSGMNGRLAHWQLQRQNHPQPIYKCAWKQT
jgi:hypothetical protein